MEITSGTYLSGASERGIHLEPTLSHAVAVRARYALITVMLLLGDAGALLLSFFAAYLLRFRNPWLPYFSEHSLYFYTWLVFWVIPFWLLVFALYQLYDRRLLFGGVEEYTRIVHACAIGVLVLILYSFLDRDAPNELSRLWLLFVAALSTLFVGMERFFMRRVVHALRRHGHLRHRALIVGANSEGSAIAEQLHHMPSAGLEVIGMVSTNGADGTAARRADGSEPHVLGKLPDLVEIVYRERADELIIASTAVDRDQLLETFNKFGLARQMDISVSPGLYEIMTTGARIRDMGHMPLVSINRLRITGLDAMLKRAMDIALTLLVLPFLLVLLPLLGLLVRLDSPGPAIHRRRVLGVGGRAFDALKFRTMVPDADARLAELLARDPQARAEFERERKLKNDPRVTRLGRFLRRTSLDELPQFVNVLIGQMSLVGPRMIAPDEIHKYGKWWMNLLTVKPGITGPWQVMGRSELTYEERVHLSMNYIRNHTLWLDVQILYQTVFVVLRGTGV